MKTTAIIEGYTIDQIFESIINIDIRKQWDKNFLTFKIIESYPEYDILYMVLKVKYNIYKYIITVTKYDDTVKRFSSEENNYE